MSETGVRQPVVMVTGDVMVQWNLTRQASASTGSWDNWNGTALSRQAGGALLVADLLEAMFESDPRIGLRVARPFQMPDSVRPGDPGFHHLYAIWAQYPAVQGARHAVWRLDEVLGVEQASQASPAHTMQRDADDAVDIQLVVINDDALGFRDDRSRWPAVISDPAAQTPPILLKLTRPLATGELWSDLYRRHADQLTVLLSVDALREMDVHISRGLSWEQTAQDLAWELVHNPQVNSLSQARALVITLDTAGAFLMRRDASGHTSSRLIFDPAVLEGEWRQAYQGDMLDPMAIATAGLARELVQNLEAPALEPAIRRSLRTMRLLHEQGHTATVNGHRVHISYPFASVAESLACADDPYAAVDVPDGIVGLERVNFHVGRWTVLGDRRAGHLDELAVNIVHSGVGAALDDVPLGRFGHLVTVDRREIESFRSIRTLIAEYALQRQQRPLSLAVFGAPGSGKSFGVTQVAESVLPGQIAAQTFNLSQFDDPDDLLGAFHQIRDIALSGKLPLVFWDEFDSAIAGRAYGWLAHFLAPMQDGSFLEGQIEHPIGRAIFVFAGGTSGRMESFGEMVDEATFRAAKGPDFLSRLKGYVNVMGPDPQPGTDSEEAGDPFAVIRRAILLRSILERNAPQVLHAGRVEIDPGVLRGFLQTRRYKHGVRSMEAIVAMSTLIGHSRYERSSLPPEAQLDLHVECRDFINRVQQLELEGELLDRLASEAHSVYRELGMGTQYGDIAYEDLPEEARDQNRAVVRDIPARLAEIGYIMLPSRGRESTTRLPQEALERLAEIEHHRYVRERLTSGWRYGPVRDSQLGTHPALVYWHADSEEELQRYTPDERQKLGAGPLPEEEKEKDRALVRSIPRILARAGYVIQPRVQA